MIWPGYHRERNSAMSNMKRSVGIALPVLSLLLLAACDSGGGGGSDATTTTATTITIDSVGTVTQIYTRV